MKSFVFGQVLILPKGNFIKKNVFTGLVNTNSAEKVTFNELFKPMQNRFSICIHNACSAREKLYILLQPFTAQ